MPKTLIWPAGLEDDAVSQYRLLLPAQALRDQGADVEVSQVGPTIAWSHDWRGLPEPPPHVRALGLGKVPEADTVVMQRPARRWWADTIPLLQAEGIRVVVDVDDDFHAIDKRHAGYDSYNPEGGGWHSKEWVAEACKRADLVTCSTPALQKAYGFGHGMVIPNCVPERYLKIEPNFKRERTVGWTGRMASHPGDLEAAKGRIGEAVNAAHWGFHVLGNTEGVQEALGLAEEPTEHGWTPFAEYPSRMAEIDVGVVPLADTRFNRAKSALKLMEFAALGVPVLASATPDNVRLVDAGVGLLVKKPHHWSKTLRTVLDSPEFRRHLAGSGRERMAKYTYERECWRWGFAWKLDSDRIHNLGAVAS